MAGITQGSNFPDYGGGHASGNDPLANLYHWLAPHGLGVVFGPQSLAKAGRQTGSEFLQSFNPNSRAGWANILSLFAPGGKFDASPRMGELGMPNQFEPYSVGKAAVGGHLGHDKAPDAFLEALKSGQNQHAHDLLFGGTVHARGAIPKRPAFNEPPADTAAAIAQKLGISPARVRAQMKAAEQHNANAAKEQMLARVLHNHGMEPSSARARAVVQQRLEEGRLSDRTYTKTTPRSQVLAQIKQMDSAKRAAVLRELVKQFLNHHN